MHAIKKTENPLISIVMSVYNGEKFVKDAIDSILAQSYENFEFIIIDDGSTDNTKIIIESFDDTRIKFVSRVNRGLTKSLNEAIQMAGGKYIARMDADDISMPNRLNEQVKFMEQNGGIAMCGSWAQFIDEKGEKGEIYKTPVNDNQIRKKFIFHNPFIHPSVMIRRDILEEIGLYNECIKYAQDYDLWSRTISKYTTANIPKILLQYRKTKTGITKSSNTKQRISATKTRVRHLFRSIFTKKLYLNKYVICSPQYGLRPDSFSGGEVYDEKILAGLAENGFHVEIILPFGKQFNKKQKNWHVKKLWLPFIHVSFLFNIVMLPYLIFTYWRTRFQVLRIHSPYYVGIGAWIFKKIFARKVALIATYHHLEKNKIFHSINKIFIKKWDGIIVPSDFTKQQIIKKYKLAEDKIQVIYNGVAEYYKSGVKDSEILKKYGITTKYSLVYCGYLLPRKNVPFLFEIMNTLGRDDVSLVIMSDGPERKKLEKLANSVSSGTVIFTGYIPEQDKLELFQSSDIFVFPSLMEGFGMAPVEAMATGIPTLVSDRGALPEVVGKGGKTLEIDKDIWISEINHLLDDPSYRHTQGQKAQKHTQMFSWKNTTETMSNFLKKFYE